MNIQLDEGAYFEFLWHEFLYVGRLIYIIGPFAPKSWRYEVFIIVKEKDFIAGKPLVWSNELLVL